MDAENFRKLLSVLHIVDHLASRTVTTEDFGLTNEVILDASASRRFSTNFARVDDTLVRSLTPDILSTLFDRLANVLEENIPAKFDQLQEDVRTVENNRDQYVIMCTCWVNRLAFHFFIIMGRHIWKENFFTNICTSQQCEHLAD